MTLLLGLLGWSNGNMAQTNWAAETITGTVTRSFSGTVNLNGKITVDGGTLTIDNTSTTAPLYIKRNWDDNNGTEADMFLIKNNGKIIIKETENTRVIFDGNGKTGRCFHLYSRTGANMSTELNLEYVTIQKMKPQSPGTGTGQSTASMSGMAIFVNWDNSVGAKYSTMYKNYIRLFHVNIDDCGDAKPTNEAEIGGGNTDCAIRLTASAYCPVDMSYCNITNNRGTRTYSGVFCAGGPTVCCVLNMDNCTCSGNYSSGWGGFLLWAGGNSYAANAVVEGTIPTAKAIITNCRFENNEAAYVGGAISSEGTVDLTNNTFIGNHAKAGGALSAFPYTNATDDDNEVCGINLLGGNEFDGNYTTWTNATFNLSTYFSAAAQAVNYPVGGGAIWIYMNKPGSFCSLTILDENLHDNYTASGRDGGAVYISATSNVPANHTTLTIGNDNGVGPDIYNNRASQGGGVALVNANLTFKAGTVRNNGYNGGTIVATNGGGIAIDGGAPTIIGGEIHDNKASALGGGIYVKSGALTANGGEIINNTAGTAGGGIYFDASSTMAVGTGTMTVKDNTVNDIPNNIYLLTNKTITVTGAFNPQYVGIYTQATTTPIKVFIGTKTLLDPVYDGMVDGAKNIFDDKQLYSALYPYNNDYSIYFSTGSPWSPLQQTVRKSTDLVDADGDGYYDIGSVKQLTAFLWYVNGITTHDAAFTPAVPNAKGELTADFSMEGHYWVPINNYTGIFDGNGYTISHLAMVPTNTSTERGLFGVNTSGTIKNVTLRDCSFSSSGTSYMGSIVSQMNGGTLSNSVSQCQLTATTATCTAGGLVGHINGGTVHSSVSLCEMTGYTMGGLVGQLTSGNLYNSFANPQFNYSGPYTDPEDPDTDINLYVGGLVAENGGTVQNCYVRLERNQSLGSALFGMLAGTNTFTIGTTNYNGTIAHSYAPDGASTQFNHSYTYLYNGATTGLSQQDLYKKADAPYLYTRSNDNKVGGTDETLTEKLNEWVSSQYSSHPDYAYWKRTTAGGYGTGGNINDDYPIHKMVGLSNAASPDGLFIEYKYSLDAMLTKYNDLEDGGTVWVYDSPLSAMTASGGTPSYESVSVGNAAKVKLYIDEEASLLQYYNANSASDNNTLTAYTSQTLPGSPRSWHFLSSSLSNSGIGFNYGQSALFNWEPNPCHVTISNDDDAALFPSDLPMSGGYADVARIDLYAFYEPEYHWINLKRNSNSHWHMNATTLPISYTNETTLTPGKGYLVSIDQDQLLQNKGTLNNGKVSIDLNYTPANSWAGLLGYNLIGNPYQSYLDFNAFVTYTPNAGLWYDNSKGADMEPTYAVYDASMGGYIQYKKGSSRGSKSATGILNMHQGFMIRVASAGKSAHFTNDMRTNEGNGVSFRGEQPAYPLINLTVTDDEGVNDFAVLELGRDRDEGAEKLRANDSKGWLYLHHGSENYGILFRSEVDDYQPLWFEADEAGSYTLSWETANAEFEALTLIDNITGVVTDMLAHDRYTFEATTEQYASRFKIVIGDYKDIEENEVPEPVEGPTFAYYANGEIHLVETQNFASLQVIDMTGRVILCRDASHASVISTDGIASGVYVLRLTDAKGTKIQKIVIE